MRGRAAVPTHVRGVPSALEELERSAGLRFEVRSEVVERAGTDPRAGGVRVRRNRRRDVRHDFVVMVEFGEHGVRGERTYASTELHRLFLGDHFDDLDAIAGRGSATGPDVVERAPSCETAPMPAILAAVLVFFCSGCILVLEILAGRLLAPYVGISLETYTSIIGTVLAGIAAGSWIGGKLADRIDPRRLLGPTVGAGRAARPVHRAGGARAGRRQSTGGGTRLTTIWLAVAGLLPPGIRAERGPPRWS